MSEPKTIVQEFVKQDEALEAATRANEEFAQQVEELTSKMTELEAANQTLTEQVDAATEQHEAAIKDLSEQVETLTLENKELAEKNAEQAKALEHPTYKNATEGGEPVEAGGEPTNADLIKQYSELTGAEKTAFWREHKTNLLASSQRN